MITVVVSPTAKAQSLADQDETGAMDVDPAVTGLNASLYVQAGRPDLAVPLRERALAMPGIDRSYAPALLWLDPAWTRSAPHRSFPPLPKKHAKDNPS